MRSGQRVQRDGERAQTAMAAAAGDARALALELAALRAAPRVDVVGLGLVLEAGELAHRAVPAWFRWRDGVWSPALWSLVVVTDRRLIVRLPDGGLRSLWWGSVVGFEVDLDVGHVVLDFGDGRPRLLSGEEASVIAVAGVCYLYGVESLASHPALESLRARSVRS